MFWLNTIKDKNIKNHLTDPTDYVQQLNAIPKNDKCKQLEDNMLSTATI